MTKNFVCIECPRGCELVVTLEGDEVREVKGNFCPKGKTYAVNECTRPLRVVASTVKTDIGAMLPVKTSKGVLKSKIFDVMAKVNAVTATVPISIGDVIICNVDGDGTDLVATKNILK